MSENTDWKSAADRLRVKQILHQAKQDIEKVLSSVERQIFEESNGPNPVFTIIEQLFARPLSPFEIEMVNEWTDEYEFELINQAIRESAVHNKRNIRYIDRILSNWRNSGIKSAEEAREHSRQFRKHHSIPSSSTQQQNSISPAVPFYNWLEE